MQARQKKAVILTLGMLLKRVEINNFIDTVLLYAQADNHHFELTDALKLTAMQLCQQFNFGKLKADEFAAQLKKLLRITNRSDQEFWDAWNSMVEVGSLKDNLELMQLQAQNYGSLFYLHSDTNTAHLEVIQKKSGFPIIDTDKRPALFKSYPLYASCYLGKSGLTLIQEIVAEINKKEINKPDSIIVVVGNYSVIQDQQLQKRAQAQSESIAAWCQTQNITVVEHENCLRDTMLDIFMDDITADLHQFRTDAEKAVRSILHM